MAAVSTRHQNLILEAMPYTKHKLKAAQWRAQQQTKANWEVFGDANI